MKKIITKTMKVINILANVFFAIAAIMNGVRYATECYIYSDELIRVFGFILMVALVNGIHWVLQKSVKEF